MLSPVAGAECLPAGAEDWRCGVRRGGGPGPRWLGFGGHLVGGPSVILFLFHLSWDSAPLGGNLSCRGPSSSLCPVTLRGSVM